MLPASRIGAAHGFIAWSTQGCPGPGEKCATDHRPHRRSREHSRSIRSFIRYGFCPTRHNVLLSFVQANHGVAAGICRTDNHLPLVPE